MVDRFQKLRTYLRERNIKSFGTVLDDNKGIGPGFDSLRIFLSIAILCFHSVPITYGEAGDKSIWTSQIGDSLAILLPAFFALSGFLVMGSAVRVGSLSTFIGFRVLRILPALATEVVLAAILIGPIATSLPLSAYFTDPLFFKYFANIVGHINFLLPGVFLDNPMRAVNVSLWTIPPEISCYIFLALMLLSGAYVSKIAYIVLFW